MLNLGLCGEGHGEDVGAWVGVGEKGEEGAGGPLRGRFC
jgi:hypothetical protein